MIYPECASSFIVRPMNSNTAKIETKGHRGPLQLSIQQDTKDEIDLRISIHSHAKVNVYDYVQ